MRRIWCLMLLVGAAATLCGCGVSEIGEVGGVKFYSVRDWSIDGPNMCAMVSHDPKTGAVTFHGMGNGPGLFGGAGTAAVGGGALAGGMIGGAMNLRPARTNVDNSNANSASAQQSQGQFQGQVQGQAQGQRQSGGNTHISNNGNGNGGGNGNGPPQ